MAALIGNQYQPDDYGAASQQSQDAYSTPASDYLSTAASDIFTGPGSAVRLEQQRYIDSLGGDSIKESDWNPSNPAYDKRIRYFDGLTTDKAAAITELNDKDADHSIAREHASTTLAGATLPARLIANLFEPLQLAELGATVVAGAATGGLADAPIIGARLTMLAEALEATSPALRSGAELTAKAAAEGTLFTAASAPAQLYGAKTMGQDYTTADFLQEAGMNTLFIGALHGAFKGLKWAKADKDPRAADPQTFDNIADQVNAGVNPDVEGATSTILADKKSQVQSKIDILERQKAERTDFESTQRDAIEDLQQQRDAIEHGLEGQPPEKLPALIEAAKAVRAGGEDAVTAAEFLKDNGVDLPEAPKAESLPPLPKELSKSSPKFGKSAISFESDVDRALYVVSDESKASSSGHAKFMDYLRDTVGMTDGEISTAAKAVRDQIKAAGKTAAGRDFKVSQIFEKDNDHLPAESRSRVDALDNKIAEMSKSVAGPDGLSHIREKLAMQKAEIAKYPSDEELQRRAGTEINRRLDTDNQSTYTSADIDYSKRPAKETNAETAMREIIEDGSKHADTAEVIAAVDAEYETNLKALDVAMACLGRG